MATWNRFNEPSPTAAGRSHEPSAERSPTAPTMPDTKGGAWKPRPSRREVRVCRSSLETLARYSPPSTALVVPGPPPASVYVKSPSCTRSCFAFVAVSATALHRYPMPFGVGPAFTTRTWFWPTVVGPVEKSTRLLSVMRSPARC